MVVVKVTIKGVIIGPDVERVERDERNCNCERPDERWKEIRYLVNESAKVALDLREAFRTDRQTD